MEITESDGIRRLCTADGAIQTAMSLHQPHALVLPYMQSMLAPLLYTGPPASVLSLGLGGGAQLRFLRHHFPRLPLTGVDVDAGMVRLAHDVFALPDDDCLQIEIMDARQYLQTSRVRQQLILVDIYQREGAPSWLFSPEFLRDCHAALTDDGIVAFNILPPDEAAFRTWLMALRAEFNRATLCLSVDDDRTIVVLAFALPPAPVTFETLRDRAGALDARLAVPFGEMVENLRRNNPASGSDPGSRSPL